MSNKLHMLEFFSKNKSFVNLGISAIGVSAFALSYGMNEPMTLIESLLGTALATQIITTGMTLIDNNITIAHALKNSIEKNVRNEIIQKYNENETHSYDEKYMNNVKEKFISKIIDFYALNESPSMNLYLDNLNDKDKKALNKIYENEFAQDSIFSKVIIAVDKNKFYYDRSRVENEELLRLLVPIVDLTEKDNKNLMTHFKKQKYLDDSIVRWLKNEALFSKCSHDLQKIILDKLTQNQVYDYELKQLNAIHKNLPIVQETKDEIIQKMLLGEVKFNNDIFEPYGKNLIAKYIDNPQEQESKDKRAYINNCFNIIFDRGTTATPNNLEQNMIADIYKKEFENTMLFEKAIKSIIYPSETSNIYAEDILYDFYNDSKSRSNGYEIFQKIQKTKDLVPKERNLNDIFTIYMTRTILEIQPMSERNEKIFSKALKSIGSMNALQSQLLYNQKTFKCFSQNIQKQLLSIKNVHLSKNHHHKLMQMISSEDQLSEIKPEINTNTHLKNKINQNRQFDESTKDSVLDLFNNRPNHI
jgi:hypothetical protein